MRLSDAEQDEVIGALEQGKAGGFEYPAAQAFFNTLRARWKACLPTRRTAATGTSPATGRLSARAGTCLFIVGSSTFPSITGFNPTLTIEALAYMSADAIAGKYVKSPGALL